MSLQHAKCLLLMVLPSLLGLVTAQLNQGVRLADSPLGSHAGRVEVKYNGAWGTICNTGFGSDDSDVICRMLNYTDAACSIGNGQDVFGQGTGNVWLSNLQCGPEDQTLDECENSSPLSTSTCYRRRVVAVMCQDPSVMPVTYDITELNQTARSVTVGWKLAFIPDYLATVTFTLNLTEADYPSSSYYYYTSVTSASREFNRTIRDLSFNTSYSISISAVGQYIYRWCRIEGNASEAAIIATSDFVPPSTLPMRLLSQNRPYIGRLQVMHSGEWGNVCDDNFGPEDAKVACWSLNYTRGAICYGTKPYPLSSAPILLDDVDCSEADWFQDCTHRGLGIHDCSSRESIALVCNPGSSVVPDVTGLRVTGVSPNSITLAWNPIPNIRTFQIEYIPEGGRLFNTFAQTPTGSTVQYLTLGTNYTIRVKAVITGFPYFISGTCFRYVYGESSEPVHAVTQESPPTAAVRVFDVSVVNSTAVEVTWRPPSTGLNGEIRGYKLFVDKVNGNQTIINIKGDMNRVYLVTDLDELSTYLFSILMYTVGDGPLSVWLQVTMPTASSVQLITVFGVYGDGQETVQASITARGFNVLCGSSVQDATFDWAFANGSLIGYSNRSFQAAHFQNSTAALQVGTALAFTRRLTVCDGGLYTCVATSPDGVEYRNFSLIIGSSQPQLDSPRLVRRGSTWIQIGWEPLDCDGGYPLSIYLVEYHSGSSSSNYSTVGRVTDSNYIIRNLSPSTEYEFRVGRESSVDTDITYSEPTSLLTLVEGPSAPREVVVRVGFNSEVCVTWRPPANPIGTVILYKLYAEVEGSEEATDAVDLPANTPVKTFPGSQTAGCMKLNVTGATYHFQMSAVAVINGANVEGTLSPYSELTTLFVPVPGVPQLVNVTGSTTNTSATLQWELPEHIQLKDAYFNVSYSGVVEWMSPAGVYTSFLEQGWKTTEDTSLTFSLLTPSTSYVFSVGIVTDDGQHGPELSLTLTTGRETRRKLVYFQVRIQNASDCKEWVAEDTEDKLSQIQESLQQSLFQLCQCRPQLSQAEFSCRTGPPDTVIYRARITGTASRSASEVAAILGAWVQANNGSVKIDQSRLHLDPTCDPTLENIHGPDCPVVEPPTESTTTMTDTPTNATTETTSTTATVTKAPTEKTDVVTTSATEGVTTTTTETTTTEASTSDKDTDGATQKVVGDGGGGESSGGGISLAGVIGIVLGVQTALVLIALLVTLIIIMRWYQKIKAPL